MRKLTHPFGKHSADAAGGPAREIAGAALGLAFIGLLGWTNLRAGRGLNFEFLYLLSCCGVGWFAGVRSALASAAFSTVCLYLAETQKPGVGGVQWLIAWNSGVRLLAFAGIAWLAGEAGRLTRELERTVRLRTSRLEDEIEEHKATARLLNEALELFKQLAENIADVFWVTDPAKQHMEYVSPAFEGVWGEACQTLYASPVAWLEGVHPEDRARVKEAASTRQLTGAYDEEYRVVRPDGSLRWVRDRAFPVTNKAGVVYRIVGIAADVTERKRDEHLVQMQRNLAVALSSTSDLSFALDRLLEVGLELQGIDCGGVYLAELESGELRLAAHRGLTEPFLAGVSCYKADALEVRLVKGGRVFYAREDQIPRSLEVLWGSQGLRALAVAPVRHQGALLGLLILASWHEGEMPPKTRVGIELLASQVSGAIARIRAEQASRQSEAHLRATVNSAPIALLAADAQGTITVQDGQALAAMGVKPGEHLRRPVTEVYQDHPVVLDNVRRALAGEEFSSVVELNATVFDCRYTPLRDAQGKPGGFVAVATDVTERFRLQREILEISDREQARIGQDVHDGLCQQLIGLAFNANSLEQALFAQQRPEAATAHKISTLLDEAITESRRVCRGLYPIRLRTQGLVPALEELAANTCERYPMHCRCQAEARELHCDMATATHLYRIAQEALNNALKHSGARTITIGVHDLGDCLELEVSDDGKGIAVKPGPGSGMGLHIMEYRARLIGGTFHFNRRPDGTTVSCRIPRVTQ
ncbi:MAG TPA: PAS domain S-box protein [Candidatus Acidoferrum sp.]|nr:PAS domain S-box protein [Candidatus Acidoferrum sp.]